MNETFDSVYPDLLSAGLSKLNLVDGRRDLLALFSAIEHFRSDLHDQSSVADILKVTQHYVAGLNLFRTTGFWLVNSADLSFELQHVTPEGDFSELKEIVNEQIKIGRFAQALRQSSEVFFHFGPPDSQERGVLHVLKISSQVVGMFGALLERDLPHSNEIHFSLLSVLLGSSADALATLRKTAQLTSQIETLSGMLPLCAWCKKIRNDKGYWEQIEKYISVRSSASFTHGVCPECQKKLLWDIKKTATG